MINYKRLISTLTVLIASVTVANAAYVGASIGYLIDGEEEMLAATVGTAFSKSENTSHNIELEIGYISDSESGISVDVTPVMVNYVMKSSKPNGVGFYAGAGVGYSFIDLSYYDYSGEELTWQLLLGMQYAFNENASLKLGYRYFLIDDFENTGIDLDDNIIEFGVVFNF